MDITEFFARRSAMGRTAAVMIGAFTGIACVGVLSASAVIGRK